MMRMCGKIRTSLFPSDTRDMTNLLVTMLELPNGTNEISSSLSNGFMACKLTVTFHITTHTALGDVYALACI